MTSADPKLRFIDPPPAIANIPAPDAGWEPPGGNPYRGIAPKKAELQALPDAIEELRGFAAYRAIFASLAPPQDQLVQLLDAAEQWSSMAKATLLWSRYCKAEEGVVWTAVRRVVARLLPAFDLALAADPRFAGKLPKTSAFLGVRRQIALSAAATKARNRRATAAGQPAFHGEIGKRRRSKAQRAALAEKDQRPPSQASTLPSAIAATPKSAGSPTNTTKSPKATVNVSSTLATYAESDAATRCSSFAASVLARRASATRYSSAPQ